MMKSKSIKIFDMKKVVAKHFENDIRIQEYNQRLKKAEMKLKKRHQELLEEVKSKNEEKRKLAVKRV